MHKKTKKSFMDFSVAKYGRQMVEETSLLGNMIALLIPIVFFWCVYDQGGNEWQYQYNMMLSSGIPVEAFGSLNTIFVLIMVPSLAVLYQYLDKRKIRFSVLQRMGLGFTLMTVAYGLSGFMQVQVINSFNPGVNTEIVDGMEACTDPTTCMSSWWLVPQWFLLSLGESLIR